MTLNTVKPRSAITRLSPSMVCATDLLLGLVMTPSEDGVLSGIRLPFEVRRSCAGCKSRSLSDSRSNLRLARGRLASPPPRAITPGGPAAPLDDHEMLKRLCWALDTHPCCGKVLSIARPALCRAC